MADGSASMLEDEDQSICDEAGMKGGGGVAAPGAAKVTTTSSSTPAINSNSKPGNKVDKKEEGDEEDEEESNPYGEIVFPDPVDANPDMSGRPADFKKLQHWVTTLTLEIKRLTTMAKKWVDFGNKVLAVHNKTVKELQESGSERELSVESRVWKEFWQGRVEPWHESVMERCQKLKTERTVASQKLDGLRQARQASHSRKRRRNEELAEQSRQLMKEAQESEKKRQRMVNNVLSAVDAGPPLEEQEWLSCPDSGERQRDHLRAPPRPRSDKGKMLWFYWLFSFFFSWLSFFLLLWGGPSALPWYPFTLGSAGGPGKRGIGSLSSCCRV